MGKSIKISIYMYLKKITHNTHTIVSYTGPVDNANTA